MAESPAPNYPASPPGAVPNFTEIGATGLKRSGGLLQEEFNPKIAGSKWFKVATEMRDNEPVIGSAMLAMELLIRQAPWEVKPKKEDTRPEAHCVAERVDKARGDMEHTWSEFVSEALNAMCFGVMPFEPVYKICRGDQYANDPKLSKTFASNYDDGFIGWRKISPRYPDSLSPTPWDFAPGTNDVVAMRQQPPPDYRERCIPIDKLLLFRVRSCKDSPEGKAIFRSLYQPFFYLRRLREYEAIGAEKDMAGLPDFQLPVECFGPNATPEQAAIYQLFKTMGPRVRRGEYECIIRPSSKKPDGQPTGYDFGLVQSGGRRPVDLHQIIQRYETVLLMILQAEFKTLGQNGVGSFAMHSDKTALFAMAIGAILDALCDLFNRTEIPRLCRYNGIPRDLYPELTHGDIEKAEIDKLTSSAVALTSAGLLVPDDQLDAHFREVLELPAREDEDTAGVIQLHGDSVPQDMLDAPIDGGDQNQSFVPQVIDGGLGAPQAATTESGSVQDTALNGAQVTAAKEIVQAVAAGELPRDSGVAMLIEFFQLQPDRADRIMGSVGRGFQPKEEPPKPSPFGGGSSPFVAKGRADEPDSHNEAHNRIQNAMAAGEIEKKPCEKCGDKDSEAHHDDYSKPLDVKWLCRSCHKSEHG